MGSRKSQRYRALGVLGTALVVVVVLVQSGVLTSLENLSLDWRVVLRGKQPIRVPIVIVEVDQESLDTFPEPLTFWGARHAKVIMTLHSLGAKAIGFDAVQDISLAEYVEPNPDQTFAQALATASGMVLTFKRRMRGKTVHDIRPNPQLLTALLLGGGRLGFDNVQPDSDEVIRSQPLLDEDKQNSFPLAIAAAFLGQQVKLGQDFVKLGNRKLQTDAEWRIPIDYVGPSGTFPRVSYKQLLSSPEAYRGKLKGAIALIGFTSFDLQDYHTVPFRSSRRGGELMAGTEVQANTVHTLLTGGRLRTVSALATWGLVGVLFALSTPIFLRASPLGAASAFLVLAVGWPLLAFMLFARAGLIAPLMPGEAAVFLNFLALTGLRYWEERHSRKEVEGLFGRYVSPEVVKYLLRNPEAMSLGGRRLPVTVLFSDIRGFTTLSERMAPEQVTAVLNEYLTEMVEIIFRNGGTVDKYIGDAIMAIYNWPVEEADHATRAVATALEMRQRVLDLRGRWQAHGLDDFRIGIGINTGPAVLGNIGSPRRMEQTAIGDTVNVASRLEGLNKEFGTTILISSETHEQAKDGFETKPVAEVQVKGRAQAVPVYEVLGKKED